MTDTDTSRTGTVKTPVTGRGLTTFMQALGAAVSELDRLHPQLDLRKYVLSRISMLLDGWESAGAKADDVAAGRALYEVLRNDSLMQEIAEEHFRQFDDDVPSN